MSVIHQQAHKTAVNAEERTKTHLYCFHQGLVIQCTLQSLRRAQTGGTRPLLSAAYSACPQTASCPLKHKHTKRIYTSTVSSHTKMARGQEITQKIRHLGHKNPFCTLQTESKSWMLSNNLKTIIKQLHLCWLQSKTNSTQSVQCNSQTNDTYEQMTL